MGLFTSQRTFGIRGAEVRNLPKDHINNIKYMAFG